MDELGVISDEFPYIPIRILLNDGKLRRKLDTGFSGEVIVPEDAIPDDIGPPAYFVTYRVADNRIVSSPVFYGDIEIPGLPPIHDVAIGVLANRYIVGVGVMELYRIILERGKQVIVEL